MKIIILILISITGFIECDHYKGGVFSSFLKNSTNMNIKYQLFYRRTGSATSIYCDDNLIQSQKLQMDDNISGVKIYYCDLDSCKYDKSLHFDFKCINYDVKYSWSAFENYKSITLNREYMSNNNLDRILIVIDNQNGEWSKQYWRNEIVYHWTHMNKLISFQNNTVQNTPPEVLSFPNHNIKCNNIIWR